MRTLLAVLACCSVTLHAQEPSRLVSTDGRTTVTVQNDGNVVVYQVQPDGTIAAVWATGTVVDAPPPPLPPPPPSENQLHGALRAVSVGSPDSHFRHDTGEVLPVGFTYMGALEQRRVNRDEFLRQIAVARGSGYQFARVLMAVGWYPYWADHEVAPMDFTAQDGRRIQGWPDYEQQVVGLGQDFAAAGLQLFVSAGDLQMFGGNLEAAAQWARRVGELLNASGVRVAFVDVNEVWQNWVTDREPDPSEVLEFYIQPFLDGYGKPTIALRSANFEGEEIDAVNRWAGDIDQKHGHRGHFEQDHTSAVRHARSFYYDEGEGVPTRQLCVESEPAGPAAPLISPVMGPIDDPEAVALLAASNFIGDCAFVYHSAAGVRAWLGTAIDEQPGFAAVPKIQHYLPSDLQSSYVTRLHGGRPESPLTDGDGFPNENRVDLVTTADGRRFAGMVYGDDGYTRLLARVAVRFSLITPDTGESHAFTLDAGETLDVYYRAGRVVVGEVR